MVGILDLADELLEMILDCVHPNDIVSFVLSSRKIRRIAGEYRLFVHERHKINLTMIDNDADAFTRYEYPELLELVLHMPRVADYVKTMIVKAWRVCWDERSGGWPRLIVPAENRPGPYPGRRLRDFEDDIKKNQTVTFAEDEQWISKMSAGDESPVIAILFPRLNYLTSLTISLGDREDFFMLKTLQRIAKDPVSSSLSRLRQLDVRGKTIPSQRVRALLTFSALPSLILLKAHWLAEGPLILAEKAYKLAPSSLRHLELVNCAFSKKTLTEVIKSAKWLRSLT